MALPKIIAANYTYRSIPPSPPPPRPPLMSLQIIAAVTVTMLFMDLLWLSLRASYHDHLIKQVQGSSPELRVVPAIMVSTFTAPTLNATNISNVVLLMRRREGHLMRVLQVYLLMPLAVWHFAVRGSKTIKEAATQVPSHRQNEANSTSASNAPRSSHSPCFAGSCAGRVHVRPV